MLAFVEVGKPENPEKTLGWKRALSSPLRQPCSPNIFLYRNAKETASDPVINNLYLMLSLWSEQDLNLKPPDFKPGAPTMTS